ncbi:dimethylhistidine N-methyltransferase [Alteromonadaceae bacterium Bs31]|nr:dimethylhistidine N-methyltransferase [Alteromonadaceae bacterium Bs31]
MPTSAARKQYDADAFESEFETDVVDGLTRADKQLSPKYFYDEQGSRFFDQICELDEYYPYKTELRLLPLVARDLSRILKDDYSVIEFGAGSLLKIRPILDWLRGVRQFLPIDISGEHLRDACASLAVDYAHIDIRPVEGDFTQEVELGKTVGKRLGFFPGSTIGNFTPQQARDFLATAKQTLGRDSYIIIGVDTKKSTQILHRAYNDAAGITAKFNLNILHRINRELSGNIPVERFEHYAHYDTQAGCIKMHLVSLDKQQCRVAGEDIHFAKGESIHTESSYKYRPDEFIALAASAGWDCEKEWLAEGELFSMFLFKSE